MKEKSVDERKTNKKTRNFFCFFPTFSDPVKEARHVAERHHRLPLGVHARAEQDQDVEADPRPPDEPDQQQPPEEREGSFLCHWPAFAVVYPVEDGVDDQGDRLRDKGGDGLVEGREPDALDRVVGDAVGLMVEKSGSFVVVAGLTTPKVYTEAAHTMPVISARKSIYLFAALTSPSALDASAPAAARSEYIFERRAPASGLDATRPASPTNASATLSTATLPAVSSCESRKRP